MADADETIVTRFVVDTQTALTEAQKFRAQVDALKAQLQQLVQQSGQSFKDIAEGMKRANVGTMTDALGKIDTKGVQSYNRALGVALRETEQEFKKSEQAAKGLDTELRSKPKDAGLASKAFSALGDVGKFVFGTLLGISAITALRKLVDAMLEAIQAGYELQKSIFRAGVAINALQFRGVAASAQKTTAMVRELREEFGTLSQKEALDVVGTTQLLTRNLGFTEDQIKNVIRVSTALAVVQGKDVAESARQLVLFFSSGYGEGLQKAGIAVNRFTVAQEAMRMGFGKSYMALTEQERAAAAYSLVMRQANDITKAAGEYQNTAAGQIDKVTKEIDTQQQLIGTKLLPIKQQWLELELKLVSVLGMAMDKKEAETLRNRILILSNYREALIKLGKPTDKIDEQLQQLFQDYAEAQKRFLESDPSEQLAKQLEEQTKAEEAAAKAAAKFRAEADKEIILKFGAGDAQKELDELEKKLAQLRQELAGIDVSTPKGLEDQKKKLQEIADLELELNDKRHQVVIHLDKADAINTLDELDQRLTDLQSEIAVLQSQPMVSPEDRDRIHQLTEEAEKLSKYSADLAEAFQIEPLDGVQDGVKQIQSLNKELDELQTYKETLIEVGADTTGIDGEINSKVKEIEAIKAQLSIVLNIDPSQLDQLLATLDTSQFGQALSDSSKELYDLVKDTNERILDTERDFYDEYGSVGEQDLNAIMDQWDTFFSQTEGLSEDEFAALLEGASRFYDNYGSITLEGLQKAAEIWQDYWDKIDQINQDEQEAIAKENSDFQESLASLRSDTQQRLQDATRKYHEQELKAERDYQERLRRLREEYLFDLEDALRERDALQVLRLMRRYNLDKEQTTRQYEQEQQERRDAYRQELADIRRQAAQKAAELRREHEQRLAEIQAQADRERAQAEEDRQRALDELRRDMEQERTERQEKYAQELEDIKKRFTDDLNEILFQLGMQYDLTDDQLTQIGSLYTSLLGPNGTIANAYDAFAMTMANIDATIRIATQNAIANLQTLEAAAAQASALSASLSSTLPSPTMTPYGPTTPGTGHAAGGIEVATKPTWALYGEAGPELAQFIPLSKLQSGEMSPVGGGGKVKIEVWLSPDLESRIVDNTLGQSAEIMEAALNQR